MDTKVNKILKIFIEIFFIVTIIAFAWSITPKTFQNDTFYTIKIGELIEKTTNKTDLLPWGKGLDMKDHFSYHNLPYTYPHWLYDLMTYKVYAVQGFNGIYELTCVFTILLGLLIYFINVKLNKNHNIAYLITLGSIYCLKNFIAARAQLVTYILFVLTILFIELFIRKKKIIYPILLVVISILIANLHCAVWPFYFVLYVPYIVAWLCIEIATFDYENHLKKWNLRIHKKNMNKNQYNEKILEINNKIKEHDQIIESRFDRTRKIEIEKNKNIKWLVLVMVICAFAGLLTPIKDVPYTYLVKTMQGTTTKSINEHMPTVLVGHADLIIILIIVFGSLIFSKTKVKLCDFFMIMGLVGLSFFSQRQISMLVVVGNFIIARMLCSTCSGLKKKIKENENSIEELKLVRNILMITIIFSVGVISYTEYREKKDNIFVDDTEYPVAAADYINEEIIPKVGKENLRLYNEYNYGSYLLFKDIPVFIDSRADLYAPEFNGQKNESKKYEGNDIFEDFIGINNLSKNYETKFSEYKITHVITCDGSKLSCLLDKDSDYLLIYSDEYFRIYERERAYE